MKPFQMLSAVLYEAYARYQDEMLGIRSFVLGENTPSAPDQKGEKGVN